MNIQEALDLADAMKPNMMQQEVKIRFLNELDGMIYEEIVKKHVHCPNEYVQPAYNNDTPGDTQLIVPAPYDMLYVYWLMSKIDLMNMEMDKYNNDRALFESQYEEMSDWYTRTHMPVQRTREFRL